MLKREFIRIGVLAGIGLLIMIYVMFGYEEFANWYLMIIPFYLIGMFYASKILLKILCVVGKTYFSYQFMSLLINPLWGTVICVLLLCVGLAAVFSFGWLIGICRCIYCLVTAYQLDKQCMERRQEYYWWSQEMVWGLVLRSLHFFKILHKWLYEDSNLIVFF